MSTSQKWFASRGEKQAGPFTLEQLKQLAKDGKLRRDDMVWTSETPGRVKAETLAAFFTNNSGSLNLTIGSAVTPAIANGASGGQFSVVSVPPALTQLPLRAITSLKGHAKPSGDVTEWPLDDSRVAQFKKTLRLRKAVKAAATLYRFYFLVYACVDVIFVVGAVVSFVFSGSIAASAIGLMLFSVPLALITLGLFFAWQATVQSKRGAPLTMFVLHLFFLAVALISLLLAAGQIGAQPALVSGIVNVAVLGVLSYVSWRAYVTIPVYLKQPAWCQELIAAGGL